MNKILATMFIAVLSVSTLYGCGKKADTQKPIEEVRAEAEKMSVGDLEAAAKAYANEIASKKSEAEKISNQLKGLSLQDMMGEKGKSIKDQAAALGNQVSALTERYQVYAQKYQAAGGDMAKIQIS